MNGQLKEGIGFSIETMLFFLAGFFLWISLILSIIIYAVGIGVALIVGNQIKKNAIKEWIEKH